MSKPTLLVLVLALGGIVACKPKQKQEAEPQPSSAQEAAATASNAQEPKSELSAAEEEAIAKEFITRFTDAIDADDASRWPAVITKERAARYAQEGVIDKVYAAWRRGTATVSERIRKAPFHLEKAADKMTLHFEGVIVANDPETGYSMTVRIDDGKMYLDEN